MVQINFDTYENDYMRVRFPDRQDESAKPFDICFGCDEIIEHGEWVLKIEDKYIHDDLLCYIRATEAIRLIAGDEE